MSSSTSSTTSSLGILSSEAEALLNRAKQLRQEMDALPKDDPKRAVYEKAISGLLESARSLSIRVTTSARSS